MSKRISNKHSDLLRIDALSSGNQYDSAKYQSSERESSGSCFCVGPQGGDKLCPCMKRRIKARSDGGMLTASQLK